MVGGYPEVTSKGGRGCSGSFGDCSSGTAQPPAPPKARLPGSMNLNRPLQIQKLVQRRPPEGGHHKNNRKEPARRRR